jgi:CDP-2,3-bis-(O-geranylgeranyl)-sn-glycerol synthase
MREGNLGDGIQMFRFLTDSNPLSPLSCAFFLITAFVGSGIAHTLWLRSKMSRRFAIPLDGGLTFRQRRILGDNKTVRGLMVIIPGTGCSFYLLGIFTNLNPGLFEGVWALSPASFGLLGLIAGVGFMLGELPNSFIKRQLGILPGEAAEGLLKKVVFVVIDRVDSLLGMLLAISLAVPTPWQVWMYVILSGPFIHWFFSYMLFILKVKGRAA